MISATGFETRPSRIVIYRPRVAGLALFAILCLSIIGLEPLSGGTKPIPFTGAGDAFRQLAYLCVFGLAFVGLRVAQNVKQIFVFSVSACLLLAWCWLSLAWAIEPSIAIRRLILTTMLMWLIFLCVEHAGFEMTADVARAVLLITLVLNYAAVAVSPIAVHQIADVADPNLVGNWRGIMAQKNFAGAVSALLIIFCLFGDAAKRPWIRWIIALAAAYFLFRSSSKTSMGILAPAVAVGWVYSAFSVKYRRVLIPIIAVAAGLVILAMQGDSNPLAGVFNRPDGLTGRVQIWPVLLAYSSDHPWLGSGFGSFWNIGTESPVFWYSHTWVSEIANGHNGYLDLLVQIGIPGLVLAVVALVISPFWALLTSRVVDTHRGGLLAACLTFCAGHNLTESSIMDRDMIIQVMLILTVALIHRATRDDPAREPAARFVRSFGAVSK